MTITSGETVIYSLIQNLYDFSLSHVENEATASRPIFTAKRLAGTRERPFPALIVYYRHFIIECLRHPRNKINFAILGN